MTWTPWTTRLDPEVARPFVGSEELHGAWFVPKDWPGQGPSVVMEIPECILHVCLPQRNGVPMVWINRAGPIVDIKGLIRSACERAQGYRACIGFMCNTADQAHNAARFAGNLLPDYERVALERMYDADNRARGNLS
jgi:hypothetical protein